MNKASLVSQRIHLRCRRLLAVQEFFFFPEKYIVILVVKKYIYIHTHTHTHKQANSHGSALIVTCYLELGDLLVGSVIKNLLSGCVCVCMCVCVCVFVVVQLCPTVCNPMNCSMPGFPVLHCLPEVAQIHVH